MHRDYDTTQRKPNIFLLNGRAFPFTLRDTPIVVKPNETTKLRVLNAGGHALHLHTHGHHPTLTDLDGYALPAGARVTRDTFDVGPASGSISPCRPATTAITRAARACGCCTIIRRTHRPTRASAPAAITP